MKATASHPTIHYLFNSYFFAGSYIPSLEIPGFRCTTHPAALLKADVVMVHLPSILSTNTADELIRLRAITPKQQIWVAESLESAANFPQMDDPDFMSLFDLEVSYRQQADVWTPYIPPDLGKICIGTSVKLRRRQCCAFVSSTWDKSGRRAYMRELLTRLQVDSYGRYMRNKRLWFDKGEQTKLRVLGKYAYTLAFENSVCPDYVTEKFFQPLMTGTIPIYLGAPNIDEFAPGDDCFVNAADFPDPAELAAFIETADPNQFHVWRRKKLRPSFRDKLDRVQRNWRDVLARALIEELCICR